MARGAGERLLTSKEAAAILAIKLPTLYAYVSRGLLHSESGSDHRSRLYRRVDVEALAAKRKQRRDPSRISRGAIDWGQPILDSAITLIDGGSLYYRGQSVADLARERTLEEVAGLIWADDLSAGSRLFRSDDGRLPLAWRRRLESARSSHPGDAFQVLLRLAAAEDVAALDVRAPSVERCGARLLGRMVSAAAGQFGAGEAGSLLVEPLARAWGCRGRRGSRLLNGALILCADHELNVSSFTARCVASAGSSPYEAVTAGLAALRGFRHGGHTDRVETLLHEMGVDQDPPPDRRTVRSRLGEILARGDRIPGFGHPLYPEGDPRHRVLLELLQESFPKSARLRAVRRVTDEGRKLVGEHPTIDFGLAALSSVLGLAPGGAWTVFALGRTVGWIGHAIEEYGRRRLIRPRARYVGQLPSEG